MKSPRSKHRGTVEGLALASLREYVGWTQQELADASGRSRTGISFLESGGRRLPRELLDRLAAVMGFDRAAVDGALYGFEALHPVTEDERAADELGEVGARELRAAACRVGLAAARQFEEDVLAARRTLRHAEALERAGEVAGRLRRLPEPAQHALLRSLPQSVIFALVERLCDESWQLAASDPFAALAPAHLGVTVAGFVAEHGERSYLRGWALAFVGNAKQTECDLAAADEAFMVSDRAILAAGPSVIRTLPVWRPIAQKAVLRRFQGRFQEALALHREALVAAPPGDKSAVLLSLAVTLERVGDSEQALRLLKSARPNFESHRDRRLRFGHRFNMAVCQTRTGRPFEAETTLPDLRFLAVELGNELDLNRVLWLSGRISAALGKREESLLSLAQAREYFSFRGLAIDVAELVEEEALVRASSGGDIRPSFREKSR